MAEQPANEPPNISMMMNNGYALGARSDINDLESTLDPSDATESADITPSPTPTAKKIMINSTAELDGFLTSSGSGSSIASIQVGRSTDEVIRGFLTFEISRIPRNAKLQKAELRLFAVDTIGNPERMGDLIIDHLIYGDRLFPNDFSGVAILSSFTSLRPDRSDPGWYTANVTRAVINDIDSIRTTSQFRVHFERETRTGSEDHIYFESGENYLRSNNLPYLLIEYQ